MATDESSDREALLDESRSLRQEVLLLRQFVDALRDLADATEAAPGSMEVMEFLERILSNARNVINAADGSLLALDEDTDELVFAVSQGHVSDEDLHWRRLPRGEGIAGWVVEQRRATVVNDTRSDARFYGGLDRELGFETRSVLAAPLVGGARVLGVVELLNKHDGRLFTTSDELLLGLLCRFAGELLYGLISGEQNARADPLS